MKTLAALLLSAISSAAFAADSLVSGPAITPAEAVEKAAANVEGVLGVFEMRVHSTAIEGEVVLLYSESNPRDPRCLAICLFPSALKEMFKETGLEPAVDLKGKTIRVAGATDVSKRKDVNHGDNPFDTYYRRTFVPVFRSEDFVVVR